MILRRRIRLSLGGVAGNLPRGRRPGKVRAEAGAATAAEVDATKAEANEPLEVKARMVLQGPALQGGRTASLRLSRQVGTWLSMSLL